MNGAETSRFLKGEDLYHKGVWRQFSLTAKEWHPGRSLRTAGGEVIPDPAIGFEETKKLMILNETNRKLLKFAAAVDDPSQCIGCKVVVYPSMGDWFGEKDAVVCRIRIPNGKPKPFISKRVLGKDITGKHQ